MRFRLRSSSVLLGLAMPWLFACNFTGDVGTGGAYVKCSNEQALELWAQAKRSLSAGDVEVALPLLVTVTKECPDLVRAHLAYQDIAKRLGGAAEQAMAEFYGQPPTSNISPVPRYLRARLADTAYAQSNALEEVLAKHPKFAFGYLSRGRIHRGQGRFSRALQSFDQALLYDRTLVEARLARAQMLMELGRDKEAAIDYQAYLEDAPTDIAAARELVNLLLYRLGSIGKAAVWIDFLEQRGDNSVALRMDKAAAMWRSKQPQAAIELYVEILREAPNTARAALNIGLLYYEILPKDDASKRRYWPQARAAFQLFLQGREATDGHEQFERTWAVPFRLRCIEELLGPSSGVPSIDGLRFQQ